MRRLTRFVPALENDDPEVPEVKEPETKEPEVPEIKEPESKEGEVADPKPTEDPAPAEPAPAEDPTPEPELEVGDNAESLETDMLDMADSEAEGKSDEQLVVEAVDTAEALEGIADIIAASMATGGLSSNGSQVVGVALECLQNIVGVQPTQMPAMESFDMPSTRQRSTEIALEGVVDTIKKVWEAIVAAVKKAIQWVSDFFTKVFSAAKRLEDRANSLKAKAKAAKGTPKEKEFENVNLVKFLNVGGAVQDNIHLNLGVFHEKIKDVFSVSHAQSTALGQRYIEMFGTSKNGSFNTAILTQFKLEGGTYKDNDLVRSPESAGFTKPPENLVLVRSQEMFGGMSVIGVLPEKNLAGKEAIAAVSDVSITVGKFTPNAKEPTEKNVPTLNAADAAGVADIVSKVAVEVFKYRELAGKLAAIKNKFHGVASRLKYTESQKDGTVKEALMAYQKVTRAFPRMIDQPAVGMASYALRTGKFLLDYVELSLKQLAKNQDGAKDVHKDDTKLLGAK